MYPLPRCITQGLFVTATDTGAGKTALLCRLIPALEAAGLALRIRKPVESGCPLDGGRAVPPDATALANASRNALSAEQICTYRLHHASSPARAAQLENVELTIAGLAAACAAEARDNARDKIFLLVEGAGGLYSPIARDGLNADLACALGLPLLVVVEDRLGCINHALLTLEAAQRRRLEIAAVVVNRTARPDGADTGNFEELKALTGAPVFKTGYVEPGHGATADIKTLAGWLSERGRRTRGG